VESFFFFFFFFFGRCLFVFLSLVNRMQDGNDGVGGDMSSKGIEKGVITGSSFIGFLPPEGDAKRISSVRYRRMVESILKEPPLYLTSMGEHWAPDVLGFLNNAVRRELQDMYYLVASMQKRVVDLSHDDIDDFYTWFDLFEAFVKAYFAMLEEVFVPWVSEKIPAEGIMAPAAREESRYSILGGIQEIDDCQGRFANLPAGEVLPVLIQALDKCAPKLVGFMADLERVVTPQIQIHFTSLEKAKYDKGLLEWIKGRDDAFFLWHLLIRPFRKNDKEHQELRKRFIESERSIFARLRLRKNYKASQVEIREKHYDIVRQFYRRWTRAATDAAREEEGRVMGASMMVEKRDRVVAKEVDEHDLVVYLEDDEDEAEGNAMKKSPAPMQETRTVVAGIA